MADSYIYKTIRDGKVSLIDSDQKVLIAGDYEDIMVLSDYNSDTGGFDYFYAVQQNGSWGILNQSLSQLIPFEYNTFCGISYIYITEKNFSGKAFVLLKKDEAFCFDTSGLLIEKKAVKTDEPCDSF